MAMPTYQAKLRALETTLVHTADIERQQLQQKLDAQALELERARMTAEDMRSAHVSPYCTNFHTNDPRHRRLSWREFARGREERCNHLVFGVIEPAVDVLEDAMRAIESIRGSNPDDIEAIHDTNPNLGRAYDEMNHAFRVLVQEESDEDVDEDSDPESEEA